LHSECTCGECPVSKPHARLSAVETNSGSTGLSSCKSTARSRKGTCCRRKQHIERLNDLAITVEYIIDREQLLASITERVPHILHFFCHGSAEHGAHLDIVSHADDEAGETTGSVKLEGRDFDPPDVRKALWFATLNACEGAAGAADELSLGADAGGRLRPGGDRDARARGCRGRARGD
jgi:hypothetical protein